MTNLNLEPQPFDFQYRGFLECFNDSLKILNLESPQVVEEGFDVEDAESAEPYEKMLGNRKRIVTIDKDSALMLSLNTEYLGDAYPYSILLACRNSGSPKSMLAIAGKMLAVVMGIEYFTSNNQMPNKIKAEIINNLGILDPKKRETLEAGKSLKFQRKGKLEQGELTHTRRASQTQGEVNYAVSQVADYLWLTATPKAEEPAAE